MKLSNLICVLIVLILAGVAHAEEEIQNIPIDQLGKRYRLVGKLHVPLGERVIVQGVVVNTYVKGIPEGRALRVQRIMGSATQENIEIDIEPYYYDWGEEIKKIDPGEGYGGGYGPAVLTELPELVVGKTYEMEGYETGHQNWRSSEVWKRTNLGHQDPGSPYFDETLVVYRAKEIEPLSFGPGDFTGRSALLAGVAVSEDGQAVMQGDGWVVVIDEASPWPKDIEGKAIETHGMYHKGDDRHTFKLIDGGWHLALLEDQLGREVELRGRAIRGNDVWYFQFRGQVLYVENMQDLPGWTHENYLKPVIIRGVLDQATLPQIEYYSNNAYENMKEYFIVRGASWEPLSALLGPERPMPDVPADDPGDDGDE